MKVKNISTKVVCVQENGALALFPDQTIEVSDGNTSVALLKEMGLVSVSASKKADKPAPVEEKPVAPVEAESVEEEKTEEPVPEQEPEGEEVIGRRNKKKR